MPGQLRRLSLPRSCRVRLPREPSHNSAEGKIEPAVDDLWSGKALFLVMPPATERDGTDAELRPQLRAGNEITPLEIRSLPRVFLPSQYPNFALSHVPPRNALTARERSRGTRMQTRTYIHGICTEICNRQIPGSQVLGKDDVAAPDVAAIPASPRNPTRGGLRLCAPTILLARCRATGLALGDLFESYKLRPKTVFAHGRQASPLGAVRIAPSLGTSHPALPRQAAC